MEIGPKIVVFDPTANQEWSRFLVDIHRQEAALLEECAPLEYISGETDEGDPIWEKSEFGPETDVEEKISRHSTELPDLIQAYNDCDGRSSKFSFRIPNEAIDFFADAASIDGYFLEELRTGGATKTLANYSVRGILLLFNGEYYGHVWYFTSSDYPEFCGLYGMKASLVNLLFRLSCDISEELTHRKGIAYRILTDGVYPLVKSQGRSRIVIPWPLKPMVPILNSLGYTEHNEMGETPERLFLRNMAGTSNYFTFDFA